MLSLIRMARKPDPSEVVVAQRFTLPEPDKPCLLLVDKPAGVTSFSVVKRVRRLTGIRKVGHSGTLDPMATGLLIVMLGKATRLMDTLLAHSKTYEATLRLGERTESYDADTPVIERHDCSHLTSAMILEESSKLTGTRVQETPIYSAVKVGGERLYRKARRGESVTLPRRVVSIYALRVNVIDVPFVQFSVDCGSGTYIRSLANELGDKLGVGAHLTQLRRTLIGDYSVNDAWTLQELETALLESSTRE